MTEICHQGPAASCSSPHVSDWLLLVFGMPVLSLVSSLSRVPACSEAEVPASSLLSAFCVWLIASVWTHDFLSREWMISFVLILIMDACAEALAPVRTSSVV